MSTTFQNAAMVLSIGIFFSLMVGGLAGPLPAAMTSGLTAHDVSVAQAQQVAALPPVAVLFASLLGYNPIQSLLGAATIHALPPTDAAYLTGHSFFPSLVSGPFRAGLAVAFGFAIVACLVAAAASWLRGGRYVHVDDETESTGQPPPARPELQEAIS
jgi:hypothetical protein